VHGGQISAADIGYSNICKQINEGLKEKYPEREVVRAVHQIIQLDHFKDMLISEDEMTVN